MFTRVLLLLTLILSFSQSSFAIAGFIKEGGGYGVKPIRELIKESEEGLHDSIVLNQWLEQREEQVNIRDLLVRYQNALRVRTQIKSLYQAINDDELRILRRKVLFIQGILIINIENIDKLMLTNKVVLDQEGIENLSLESLSVLGIQMEEGYFVIDLLRQHMIESIQTDINEGLELVL